MSNVTSCWSAMAFGPNAASKLMRVPKIFDAASIAAAPGRPFYPCPWCSETITYIVGCPDSISLLDPQAISQSRCSAAVSRVAGVLGIYINLLGSCIRTRKQTLLQAGGQAASEVTYLSDLHG